MCRSKARYTRLKTMFNNIWQIKVDPAFKLMDMYGVFNNACYG